MCHFKNGCSIVNHPFGVPPSTETPIWPVKMVDSWSFDLWFNGYNGYWKWILQWCYQPKIMDIYGGFLSKLCFCDGDLPSIGHPPFFSAEALITAEATGLKSRPTAGKCHTRSFLSWDGSASSAIHPFGPLFQRAKTSLAPQSAHHLRLPWPDSYHSTRDSSLCS